MYFNDQMFNPQYVNPQCYYTIREQVKSNVYDPNQEVINAVKAMHDLCETVKKLDNQYQQIAFYACLAEIGKEFNW